MIHIKKFNIKIPQKRRLQAFEIISPSCESIFLLH